MSEFNEVLNIMFKAAGGCFLYWIKTVDNMSEKSSRYMNENTSKTIFYFKQ